MPVMRDVGADEHKVAGLEQLDVIGHEASARSTLNECQFGFAVVMPVVALSLQRNRLVGREHNLPPADAVVPAQEAKSLARAEPDVFAWQLHGGDGWHQPREKATLAVR